MFTRKFLAAVLSILVLLLPVAACSGASVDKGYEQPLQGALRVLVYQDDFFGAPDYEAALDAFRTQQPALTVEVTLCTDPDEFASLLTADLAAGTPADVVLCNSYGGTDVYRLFAEGYLTDLTSYLAHDGGFAPSDYYAAALDACRTAETTFALPLSISPALLLSSEERLAGAGLDWASAQTANERLALLTSYVNDALAADPNASPYMSFPNDANLSNAFLHPAGLSLADHTARSAVLPTEAELKACLDWFLAADASSMNGWRAGFVQQARGLDGKWNALCRNVTLAQPSTLPDAAAYRLLDAVYTTMGETMCLLACPTFPDPTTYAATVTSCGVLPAGSANPDAAYACLRYLMDWTDGTGFGFPVRRDAAESVLSESDRPYAAQLLEILNNLGKAFLYESWSMENDLYTYVQDSAYAQTGEDFAGLADSLARRVDHYLTTEAWQGN